MANQASEQHRRTLRWHFETYYGGAGHHQQPGMSTAASSLVEVIENLRLELAELHSTRPLPKAYSDMSEMLRQQLPQNPGLLRHSDLAVKGWHLWAVAALLRNLIAQVKDDYLLQQGKDGHLDFMLLCCSRVEQNLRALLTYRGGPRPGQGPHGYMQQLWMPELERQVSNTNLVSDSALDGARNDVDQRKDALRGFSREGTVTQDILRRHVQAVLSSTILHQIQMRRDHKLMLEWLSAWFSAAITIPISASTSLNQKRWLQSANRLLEEVVSASGVEDREEAWLQADTSSNKAAFAALPYPHYVPRRAH